jgi:ATP-binding cassette subfamily G (WHITE) protein 2
VNSFRVIDGLHRLARDHGKTIIFSIHSPDARLYELFDQIMVLAKGYLMYCGPRQGLAGAMAVIANSPCPPHYNPADFAIHTLAAISDEDTLMRWSQQQQQQQQTKSDISSNFDNTAIDMISMSKLSKTESQQSLLVQSDDLGAYTQPWLLQVGYTCQRSLVDAWRNPYLLRLQYILIISAALVLGGLFFQMTLNSAGAQNRLGLLFFVCTVLMVVTLPSIDTFFVERSVFLREKAAGYYSASAYFTAKALSDVVPLRLIPPIIFTCIMYPMTGLRLQTASYFFWFMLVVILLSYCSTGLCLLISSLCPSVAVGNLSAILVMLFEMLFGGLLLSTESLPSGIAWLKWLSFVFYAYNALMVNEFTNLTFNVAAGSVTVPLNGQFFLTFFGLEGGSFYLCIYLLIAQGIVFYFVSGLVLYFRKEKR